MLTHPMLQARSRRNDAVHEDSGGHGRTVRLLMRVLDPRQLGGAGKWGGVKDHRGAGGYKCAYHSPAVKSAPSRSNGLASWIHEPLRCVTCSRNRAILGGAASRGATIVVDMVFPHPPSGVVSQVSGCGKKPDISTALAGHVPML